MTCKSLFVEITIWCDQCHSGGQIWHILEQLVPFQPKGHAQLQAPLSSCPQFSHCKLHSETKWPRLTGDNCHVGVVMYYCMVLLSNGCHSVIVHNVLINNNNNTNNNNNCYLYPIDEIVQLRFPKNVII